MRRPREPFEVTFLALFFILGLAVLLDFLPPPRSLTAQVSTGGEVLWAIGVVFGAATALVGIYWPQRALPLHDEVGLVRVRVTPLLLEQFGLVVAASTALVYGAALIATNGWATAALPAAFQFAFVVAALWQFGIIRQVLRSGQ